MANPKSQEKTIPEIKNCTVNLIHPKKKTNYLASCLRKIWHFLLFGAFNFPSLATEIIPVWEKNTRWWFSMFFFFTPNLGEMIQFDGCMFFKWVGNKPPARTPSSFVLYWRSCAMDSFFGDLSRLGSRHDFWRNTDNKSVWRVPLAYVWVGENKGSSNASHFFGGNQTVQITSVQWFWGVLFELVTEWPLQKPPVF